MIERCDDFREQYGEAITGILGVVLKIVRKFRDKGVFPSGQKDAEGNDIMAKFELDLPLRPIKVVHPETGNLLDHLAPQRVGNGESIELVWGPYFAPTDQDNALRIQNALAADNTLVPTKYAVAHVQEIFGLEDPEAAMAEMEKAQEEQADPNTPPGQEEGGGAPPFPPPGGPPTADEPNGKKPNPFAGRP